MTRGGAPDERTGPERRCIVSGAVEPKSGLVRFVIGPDDAIVPDILEKLPGRGIWIGAERGLIDRAVTRNLFTRAARRNVTVPADLTDQVERQLVRHVVELVALCRKSGRAVAGFEKVKSWLADRKIRVLLQAHDGSERGKGKLWTPEGARYFSILSAAELGLAFGRESVIHGALAAGGLADRVVEEASRLKGLREGIGIGDAGKDKTA